MELRHLRYFASVAQTLNFRKAAEALHITRPALSMQIRNLEDELGVLLLERSTTRVSLTDAGKAYLKEVKRILLSVDQATAVARKAANLQVRRLFIGEVGPLTPNFMPSTLRTFRQKFPQVEVTMLEINEETQLEALRTGKIEVCFLVDDNIPEEPDLIVQTIASFDLCIALSHYHPLAKRKSLRLSELTDTTFIVMEKRIAKAHRHKTLNLFKDNGLPAPATRSVSSWDTLQVEIAAEQGVSIFIDAPDTYRSESIRLIPLKGKGAGSRIHLMAVYKKENTPQIVRDFVNILHISNGNAQ